jgi:cyclic pyranopterin monophosphate synthase
MATRKLTHLDKKGNARMVDVGGKGVTTRRAVAEGFITLAPGTLRAISAGKVPKGEVLNTARIAGILAAKRCGELIPLCHPLALDSVTVDFRLEARGIRITAVAGITAKTGVEMEALTAVAVAGLTIYDMCKGIDRGMVIGEIRLVSKTGGSKS